MTKLRLLTAAATGALALMSASANALTINTAEARCESCTTGFDQTTGGGFDFVNGLGVGDIFRMTSADFNDGLGKFDAIVEVIGIDVSNPNGSDPGNASSINVSGINNWMHWRFTFVDAGTNDQRSLDGISFVNVYDIDSNAGAGSGADFTDVGGTNLPVAGLGGALEANGFQQPGAPTSGFNYARLDPEFIPGNGWRNEPNYTPTSGFNELDFVASFGTAGVDLGTFDLVWGSTGIPGRRTRGFDIRLSADNPIPVPAAAFLFAPAMGLAAWRRRRAAK